MKNTFNFDVFNFFSQKIMFRKKAIIIFLLTIIVLLVYKAQNVTAYAEFYNNSTIDMGETYNMNDKFTIKANDNEVNYEAGRTQIVKLLNYDNDAKYFYKKDKITLNLVVGRLNGIYDEYPYGCLNIVVSSIEPGKYDLKKSYLLDNFSDSSYGYDFGNEPTKRINVTLNKSDIKGEGIIGIYISRLEEPIIPVDAENEHGEPTGIALSFVSDEFGNIIMWDFYTKLISIEGESLPKGNNSIELYSRKKLYEDGRITKKQYEYEETVLNRNSATRSYDITKSVKNYNKEIDLDDDGVSESVFLKQTENINNSGNIEMKIVLNNGAELSETIGYNKIIKVYENRCLSTRLNEDSFVFYSIVVETINNKNLTYFIGFKDNKLICKEYDGSFTGVRRNGNRKIIVKFSDMDESLFIENDMTLYNIT